MAASVVGGNTCLSCGLGRLTPRRTEPQLGRGRHYRCAVRRQLERDPVQPAVRLPVHLGPHSACQNSLGAFASQWAIRLRACLSARRSIGRSEPDSHTEHFGELQPEPEAVTEPQRESCGFAPTTTCAGAIRSTHYHYPGGHVSLRSGRGQCELLADAPLDCVDLGELGHLEV